jgi:hypothetical protein
MLRIYSTYSVGRWSVFFNVLATILAAVWALLSLWALFDRSFLFTHVGAWTWLLSALIACFLALFGALAKRNHTHRYRAHQIRRA